MNLSHSLTILAVEGPMLRAYANALRHMAVLPQRVVTLVPRRDPKKGTEIGYWLPRSLRTIYATRMNEARQNYWPRRLKRMAPNLVGVMREKLAARFPFFERFFKDLEVPSNYHGWAEAYDVVRADGWSDPVLPKLLANAGTILYTGGGIVPASLLAIPDAKFLHVHPGLFPHVRGADGLLWSMLVRGRPGRTAFFMTPELDAGPILFSEEVEPLQFLLDDKTRPDDQVLYRALYSYYDPCFRAELAAKLLIDELPCVQKSQDAHLQTESCIFPFMSKRLRSAALLEIFPSK